MQITSFNYLAAATLLLALGVFIIVLGVRSIREHRRRIWEDERTYVAMCKLGDLDPEKRGAEFNAEYRLAQETFDENEFGPISRVVSACFCSLFFLGAAVLLASSTALALKAFAPS